MNEHESSEKLYARWVAIGVRLGFGALVASFFVYLTQLMPASIPPEELPRYWGLPVAEYLAATGTPTGWGWVARLGYSDVLNFVGVAILGAISIACYMRVLPTFSRARDRLYVAICVAQIVVLLVAASGVLH